MRNKSYFIFGYFCYIDRMGYFIDNRRMILLLGICLFIIGLMACHMSSSNKKELLKYIDGLRGNDEKYLSNKFDTLAPCGEVCTYNGRIADDKPATPYPQLTKNIDCANIMSRMAYRHHKITKPPPKSIPKELLDAYTQNGQVKIHPKDWYFDNTQHQQNTIKTISKERISTLIRNTSNGENVNTYGDGYCALDMVKKYSKHIAKHTGVVIGTLDPWLEAMLLAHGARHVTTLEYNALSYDGYPQLSFFDPYSYAEKYLRGETEPFEVAATFSSLEHSGLGRYGDPMNPYGDLEAMAQVWCMLKPGATFIVGIPGSLEGPSQIQWNAHRIYGLERLPHLTANWNVVDVMKCADIHSILVLTKPVK